MRGDRSRVFRGLSLGFYISALVLLVLSVLSWFVAGLEPLKELIVSSFVLVASIIVALLLVAVFADFESGGSTPRDLAAMAALAGLSAAARIPFAALPNIQPCTFLILAGGYVFGSRKGFVIGAVTALVSNFYLGQGPWTLWQMLAWGLVGASGGLLARAHGITRGSKHRATAPEVSGGLGGSAPVASLWGWRLAGFAALAFAWGFLYDWLLNLWMFMFFPFEPQYLLVIILPGLPFDVAHAVGNAAFALALGPFVVDNLLKVRERMTVEYKDREPEKEMIWSDS